MKAKSLHPPFLFLLCFLFVHPGTGARANDDADKILKKLKQAIDAEREGKKSSFTLEEDNSRDFSNDICVHCPKVGPLTKQLNDILGHLADQEKNEHPYLEEEVSKLEGLYYLTIDGAWSPGEKIENCKRTELRWAVDGKNDLSEEEIVQLDEAFMNIDELQGLQYIRPGDSTRVYYLRGARPHRDKIIRVVLPPGDEQKAQVTYFRIKGYRKDGVKLPDMKSTAPLDYEKPPKLSDFSDVDSDSFANEEDKGFQLDGDKSVGFTLESGVGVDDIDDFESWSDEQKQQLGNYLSAKYGLEIDREEGIPKKVRILDIEGSYQVTEKVRLEGSAVVDSSEQRAEVQLVDDENTTYATVKIKGEEATYRIPISMGIAQTGWRIQGALEGRIKGGSQRDRLKLDMISSNGHVYKAKFTNKDGETDGLITHERNVAGGRLSFEVGEDEQWIRYNKKF